MKPITKRQQAILDFIKEEVEPAFRYREYKKYSVPVRIFIL